MPYIKKGMKYIFQLKTYIRRQENVWHDQTPYFDMVTPNKEMKYYELWLDCRRGQSISKCLTYIGFNYLTIWDRLSISIPTNALSWVLLSINATLWILIPPAPSINDLLLLALSSLCISTCVEYIDGEEAIGFVNIFTSGGDSPTAMSDRIWLRIVWSVRLSFNVWGSNKLGFLAPFLDSLSRSDEE